MSATETPWIDEAGYWHKNVIIPGTDKETLDLSVAARLRKDGTVWFHTDIEPSAMLANAAMIHKLHVQYESLSEAKKVCDEIADILLEIEANRSVKT